MIIDRNEKYKAPTVSEKIYIATTVGAFFTKDGGREWEERMNGMKEVHIVTAIAVDFKDSTILYGGTTGGMYRSDDAAMSWKRINNGLIPERELMASMALGVNAIELDRANPTIVYAGTTKGLFRTTNKGEQWERIGQSLPDPFISSILLHPREPSQLYVGGSKGIWKSSDSGKTWQEMNQGIATRNIRALAMNPKNPQLLYAGTNGSGLYRSTDAGATWAAVPLTAAPAEIQR